MEEKLQSEIQIKSDENSRLREDLKEEERRNSKKQKELRELNEEAFQRLEAVITKLKQEIIIEEKLKSAAEEELQRLKDEYDLLKDKLNKEKTAHKSVLADLRRGFESKTRQLEKRSEK